MASLHRYHTASLSVWSWRDSSRYFSLVRPPGAGAKGLGLPFFKRDVGKGRRQRYEKRGELRQVGGARLLVSLGHRETAVPCCPAWVRPHVTPWNLVGHAEPRAHPTYESNLLCDKMGLMFEKLCFHYLQPGGQVSVPWSHMRLQRSFGN